MSGPIGAMSTSGLIQFAINCWTELLFLMLTVTMLIGVRQDRHSTLTQGLHFPLREELLTFYIVFFFYNLCYIINMPFDSWPGRTAAFIVRITTFGYYAAGGFQTLFLLHILRELSGVQRGTWLGRLILGFQVLQLPSFVLLILTPFTGVLYRFDANNTYLREWGYDYWQSVTILTFVFIGIVLLVRWKRTDRFLKSIILSAVTFPLAGFFLTLWTGINLNNPIIAFTAMVMFMLYEKNKMRLTTQYVTELEAARRELAESRVTMMLAQIKPHYIYNVMNAVMELCYSDPEKAAETIGHFSDYLQGTIEAIDKQELSPFSKELELIQEYLAVEYADPNKVFRVEFDLKCTDFQLPALTVQPLVENAVKHGIDRYSPDSLVCLHTWEEAGTVCIRVSDNGTAEQGDDSLFAEKRGIALRNVTERLRTQCSGTLNVTHGEHSTQALIRIQSQGRNEHAYDHT
ncbi:MAG: histidine kinase [Oscillospiraceae bacterium]|nr:histidine kinase [Oscillospiraceae bacterium]